MDWWFLCDFFYKIQLLVVKAHLNMPKKHNMAPLKIIHMVFIVDNIKCFLLVCHFWLSVCSPDWHQALGDWPTGFPDHHDEDWSYQTFPVHRLPPQVQFIHMLTTSLFSSSHHMGMTHISLSKLSSQCSLFSVVTWRCSQQTGWCFRGGDDFQALAHTHIVAIFVMCSTDKSK